MPRKQKIYTKRDKRLKKCNLNIKFSVTIKENELII